MRLNENNVAVVSGTMLGGFQYDHTCSGEKFMKFFLLSDRLSEAQDVIPVIVSERLLSVADVSKGSFVEVIGEYRSYNWTDDEKMHLDLFLFAREISFDDDFCFKVNEVILDGFVCKPPAYRETPSGREIADVLLAVNRPYGKSDYIPCILWGRNARFSESFEVGERIKVWGRIQSREYQKRIADDLFEKRVAYEVSVGKVEITEE